MAPAAAAAAGGGGEEVASWEGEGEDEAAAATGGGGEVSMVIATGVKRPRSLSIDEPDEASNIHIPTYLRSDGGGGGDADSSDVLSGFVDV